MVDRSTSPERLQPPEPVEVVKAKDVDEMLPLSSKPDTQTLAQIDARAVLNSLRHGQDALRKDVAAIEQEKVNLWEIMRELQKVIHACRQLDTALGFRLAKIGVEDAEKGRIVNEEVLFYVRQKEQDLLTQLAVSVQGYLALDVIRKNNLELIKGWSAPPRRPSPLCGPL